MFGEYSDGFSMEQLPAAARDYLDRMEELTGVPIHIVSTGPERSENILQQHPFGI